MKNKDERGKRWLKALRNVSDILQFLQLLEWVIELLQNLQ